MVIVEGSEWFAVLDYYVEECVYAFECVYPSFYAIFHCAAQFGDGV